MGSYNISKVVNMSSAAEQCVSVWEHVPTLPLCTTAGISGIITEYEIGLAVVTIQL